MGPSGDMDPRGKCSAGRGSSAERASPPTPFLPHVALDAAREGGHGSSRCPLVWPRPAASPVPCSATGAWHQAARKAEGGGAGPSSQLCSRPSLRAETPGCRRACPRRPQALPGPQRPACGGAGLGEGTRKPPGVRGLRPDPAVPVTQLQCAPRASPPAASRCDPVPGARGRSERQVQRSVSCTRVDVSFLLTSRMGAGTRRAESRASRSGACFCITPAPSHPSTEPGLVAAAGRGLSLR